jgi:NAD-dependent dihydropyrimidine dehydrogenase PreA subunit
MKRKIIRIDEEKCNGCGDCIPSCPEGAIQLIDDKARLISDLFCDGLGACLGHCPEGAIIIEEREAQPYDEAAVMRNVIRQGPNVIKAHLEHLQEHGETEFLRQAVAVLQREGIHAGTLVSLDGGAGDRAPSGCPGSRSMSFAQPAQTSAFTADSQTSEIPSQLTHWPIQLHLVSPYGPQYRGSHLLLAADCVAFAVGDFHTRHLKGRSLAIACPKLDEGQEIYLEKVVAMIDEAQVEAITVMIMEVPCCMGLLQLVRQAAAQSERKVPVSCQVVGIRDGSIREIGSPAPV